MKDASLPVMIKLLRLYPMDNSNVVTLEEGDLVHGGILSV
jgi:hypothetical protein